MLKIVICDDEVSVISQLHHYLIQYRETQQEELEILTFQSAKDLLSCFQNQFDILILDVELQEENGIELARQLRNQGCDAIIIFVTQYLQFATEGYKVNAYRYLLKPVTYLSFQNELHSAFIQAKIRKKEITVLVENHVWKKVSSSQILSAEVFKRNTVLFLENSEVHTLEPLKSIYAKLEPIGFIKVYKNSIVNPEKIADYDNTQITMSNGRTIPISRYRYAEFKKKYMEYWERII